MCRVVGDLGLPQGIMAQIAVAAGESWYPVEWWGEKQYQNLLRAISPLKECGRAGTLRLGMTGNMRESCRPEPGLGRTVTECQVPCEQGQFGDLHYPLKRWYL